MQQLHLPLKSDKIHFLLGFIFTTSAKMNSAFVLIHQVNNFLKKYFVKVSPLWENRKMLRHGNTHSKVNAHGC
jgi:hypothetical protein